MILKAVKMTFRVFAVIQASQFIQILISKFSFDLTIVVLHVVHHNDCPTIPLYVSYFFAFSASETIAFAFLYKINVT